MFVSALFAFLLHDMFTYTASIDKWGTYIKSAVSQGHDIKSQLNVIRTIQVFTAKFHFKVRLKGLKLERKVVHCRMPIFIVLTAKVGDRFDLLISLIDQAKNFLIVLKSSMSSTSNNTERYSYHNLVVFWFYVISTTETVEL